MLSNKFINITKSAVSKFALFKSLPKSLFSTKITDVVKMEIDHEEKNYAPVSSEDKNTFLSNSGFKFDDSTNTTQMQLKKTKGNYEVVVTFQAR